MPSDPFIEHPEQHGFWIEVRALDNRTLYRRVMHDPFTQHHELFLQDGENSIVRIPRRTRARTFIVEIPEIDGAVYLVLVSSALGRVLSVSLTHAE